MLCSRKKMGTGSTSGLQLVCTGEKKRLVFRLQISWLLMQPSSRNRR